jgi:hypothetical protein
VARQDTLRSLAVACAAAAFALVASSAEPAQARVPYGFVGTMADGPLFDPAVDLHGQIDTMARTGVESLRVAADWRVAQPYASFADVPPGETARFRDEGGVPTDYAQLDAVVANATEQRIRVLPVVVGAPQWAARTPGEPATSPSDPAPYARFVAALARRYGPGGSFWAEHPRLPATPLREWQIWNEPSLREFWHERPWARGYVALLRAARTQLLVVDPGARVILAGLPNRSWTALASIYRAGGRGQFDAVALHPFTATVAGVVEILQRGRKVMARNGDARKPLLVTELSWASAAGKTEWKYGIEVTERGQAARLRQAYAALAARRRILRIERVYWYTWLTQDRDPRYPFDYAGLARLTGGQILRKPAFQALRDTALRLEGCGAKPAGARSCAR